jgi:hypothetical protein
MTLVANFKWKFLYDFTSASSIDYKIVGNAAGAAQGWDSPYKWGQGGVFGAGNNATASVTPGRYAFELDEVLNSASLTRVGDLPISFSNAYPGRTLTEVAPNGLTYLANYAFGGNATTQATLPVQDTSDPTQLRLVVVFRTDDSTLPLSALGGEATTNLSGAWDLPGVTVADGDSTGLPSHLTRKVISVDRGSDPKKFLRATVTK